MRSSKSLYISIFLLVLISACLAVWVYYLREGTGLLNFTISIVGFCVAVLALFVSVRTYASIDSVNNISKMDGNVLDNENYVISLPELVCRFTSKDEKVLDKELFESIELKLKNESRKAAHFADTLQYMIDLIVLFPAVFNASKADGEVYKKRMDNIFKKVDKKHDILHSISKGNSIQITESIKLFKAVVSYQSFVANGDFNIDAALLHVRGPILRNPVTKTIYHNYLGLYYNKKGMHLVREFLNLGSLDILSIDGLCLVQKNIGSMPPSITEEVTMYLRSACNQFDCALEISSEDVMWPGFINYNKARTLYFLNLLTSSNEVWVKTMDEAIECRSMLNRLIDETLTIVGTSPIKIKDTHLREFFLYQEELSRLVKVNLLCAEKIHNRKSMPILYRGKNLFSLSKEDVAISFINIERFSVINVYQDRVLKMLV